MGKVKHNQVKEEIHLFRRLVVVLPLAKLFLVGSLVEHKSEAPEEASAGQ